MKTDIAKRIVELSSMFSTDKEFLDKCGITNSSLITELRKGRMKSPGAETLADIVRGSGCSGTWLLTGEGEMFGSGSKAGAGPDEPFSRALTLIERIEQQPDAVKEAPLPEDLEVRLARLLTRLLERRNNNGDA